MALGDGIRRNIAHVSQAERDRFIAAILKLDRERFFPDGVSYFDKQEDIHKNAHAGGADVHGGPAFIPWHRELCNRFEALLREVDPDLSLHYWDWTVDPRSAPDGAGGTVNLFTAAFMGGIGNPAGPPLDDFESTEPGHAHIWREVGANVANADGTPAIASDASIKNATDFADFHNNILGPHADAHGYIGGSLADAHFSFHDPFVFLLHSNLDRLWAEWQTDPAHLSRLNSATAYGSFSAAPSINENIQPWAGDVGTGATPLRPWAPPDNMQLVKQYKDLSVVTPPCYDTLPTTVRVVTAENPGMEIRFDDVPTGETAIRAAVFSIRACGEVTLRITAGPNAPFSVHLPVAGVLDVPHHPQLEQIGRIWFRFTGGAPGAAVPPSDVTVHCDETGQDFVFHLVGSSIARPTVAVMMTLDQSGSMNDPAGIDPTTKRIDVLHQAAASFVNLVQDNNGVGIVSFDQAAHPRLPVTQITGGVFDPGRAAAVAAVQAIAPAGSTSIGNGLQAARNALNAVTGYDQKALVVFTDGLENTPLWISDVSGSINDRTFAVGLGTAQQVSAGALTALANRTQGYLLLSGPLSPSVDDYFRLTKYFLQILAGVTNNDIVTDPSGYIEPGTRLRIPFELNEADIDATVILLSDAPVLRFAVETPDGDVMTPVGASAVGATYRAATGLSYYRFNLPLFLGGAGAGAQVGTWHAVLEFDRRGHKPPHDDQVGGAAAAARRRVRYSVSAHAFSNLRMRARVSQSSMEPGAHLTLRATLSEYRVPVEGRATVHATIERPDGSVGTIALPEVEPGAFEASMVAADAGVFGFNVRAAGGTMRGQPFTREHLLSAVVVHGGNQPPPVSDPGKDDGQALCDLLRCLLGPEQLGRTLEAHGVGVAAVRRCLDAWCKQHASPMSPDALAERTGTAAPAGEMVEPGLSGPVLAALADIALQLQQQSAPPRRDDES
jgi:Common central domain of tyrosinase/von Willebrand factor type A domain